MSKNFTPIKNPTKKFLLCPYCIRIKERSRKFYTMHALKWHVTHDHNDEVVMA